MGVVKVKKPKAIIFDVSGTAAKTHFVEKVLMGYLKDHLKEYLDESWNKVEFQKELRNLRQQVETDREEDSNIPAIPKGSDPAIVKQAVYDNIMYYVDNRKDSPAHQMFKFSAWFHAYRTEQIRTPIYSDVVQQLKRWKRDDRIKLYVFSNGWSQAQKVFLSRTNHGDMSELIDGHFDTDFGDLKDPESYKKILTSIREDPGNCVFLTKSAEEARAADSAGIKPILVLTHRRNVEKIDKKTLQEFKRIRTFYELQFE